MNKEKRRNQRKPLERRAWIDRADNSPLTECALGNMSDTGAKLVFTEPPQLPDEFILRLTADGCVARKCRLAWTDDVRVGVQFLAKLINGPASAMPVREA
jgi:hypothetical protein